MRTALAAALLAALALAPLAAGQSHQHPAADGRQLPPPRPGVQPPTAWSAMSIRA